MSDWEGAIDPVYFEDTYYLGAGKDGTVSIAHVPRPPANAPDRSRHVHLARHSVVLATRCSIPGQMPRYPRLRRWRPPGRRLGDAASKARPPWHLVCYLKEDVLRLTGVKKVKPFTRLSIVVLWLIALPQLLLFIASWEITLNGAPVPLWLSVLWRPSLPAWRSWSGGNGRSKKQAAPRTVRTHRPASVQSKVVDRVRGRGADDVIAPAASVRSSR